MLPKIQTWPLIIPPPIFLYYRYLRNAVRFYKQDTFFLHVVNCLLDTVGWRSDGVRQVTDGKNLIPFRGAVHRREVNAIISGKAAYKDPCHASTAQVTVEARFRYMVIFDKS